MVEIVTIMTITFGTITFIDHLLSFSPDGYPKSIFQGCIWIGHKIYIKLNPNNDRSDDFEMTLLNDGLKLKEVRI